MHLLNKKVKFDRFYDKIAISFFEKSLGVDHLAIISDPYNTYCKTVIDRVRESLYMKKAVIFGVDARVDETGKELHRDLTVCASNDDVYDLYRKAPDIIIPFMSINPLRPNALELIDKYAEMGFKGVKFLQNYWNVDTRQDRFKPFFKKLADMNLPIVIHIGSESSVKSHKECEKVEMLYAPLEAGATTIAAHMGLEYSPMRLFKAFSKNPKNFGENYYRLLKMLENHDNLFADISAILTPVRAKVLPHLAKQDSITHKILFGTDFPVPFTTLFNTHDIELKRRKELCKIKNPFDRYIETMLEYFPKNHPIWSNYEKVLGFI